MRSEEDNKNVLVGIIDLMLRLTKPNMETLIKKRCLGLTRRLLTSQSDVICRPSKGFKGNVMFPKPSQRASWSVQWRYTKMVSQICQPMMKKIMVMSLKNLNMTMKVKQDVGTLLETTKYVIDFSTLFKFAAERCEV